MYWDDMGILQLNQNNPNIPAGVIFPNTPITVVHRFDSSGTTFVFTGYLSSSPVWLGGQSKQPKATTWAANALASPQNAGVASTVQTVPDTIGFQELNVYGGVTSLTRAQALVNYLWFVVHDGQNQATLLSYVALPSSVITNAEATIRTITHNGQTLHS